MDGLRDWFHVTGSTYGAWLRGDPRGFRTRHHREDVPYDYRHPPPEGMYDEVYARSKRLMNRPPVRLSWEAREVAIREIVRTLAYYGVAVRCACVGPTHFHLLIRGRRPTPTDCNPWASRRDGNDHLACVRHHVGNAKRRSARALADRRLVPPGGVWGKRVDVRGVRTVERARRLVGYIRAHAGEGAVVLDDPAPRGR